jgi:hypothetical protein
VLQSRTFFYEKQWQDSLAANHLLRRQFMEDVDRPSLLDIKYQDSTLTLSVSVCLPNTWPDLTSNFVKAREKQRIDSAILSV